MFLVLVRLECICVRINYPPQTSCHIHTLLVCMNILFESVFLFYVAINIFACAYFYWISEGITASGNSLSQNPPPHLTLSGVLPASTFFH